MKFTVTPLLLVSTAYGFTISAPSFRRISSTAVFNARIDSADAVAAALAASKEYGPTSKEARLAWEAVEEMDSSDNSNAYTGGVSDEECLTDDFSIDACKQYESRVSALAEILESQKATIESVKNLASEISALKISSPDVAKSIDSVELRMALESAKTASEKFGADSTEAKLAWETVEEIASSDNSEASKPSLYDECLVESIDACNALEELSRVMFLNKNKLGSYSG